MEIFKLLMRIITNKKKSKSKYAVLFCLFIIGNLAFYILKLNRQNSKFDALNTSTKLKIQLEKDIFRNYIENGIKLYLNEKYLRIVKFVNKNEDSKYIVDRSTKQKASQVLRALNDVDENNIQEIKHFIETYLNEPGVEITNAVPPDWQNFPRFIDLLTNPELIKLSRSLNMIWLELFKTFDYKSILKNGTISSHLPMKHPFIVPGGRFLEMYYWDNYWILEGLLVCEMYETARMLIENLMHFIELFGFVPNGSRIYYLNRSQPPYFSQMVMRYFEASQKSNKLSKQQKKEIKTFVLDLALDLMQKEYEFWMKEKVVEFYHEGKHYILNVFKANTTLPRPESYFEDKITAEHCSSNREKSRLFQSIATAAESGYDFSSRWFEDFQTISSIQTIDLIPIDLNAIMYKNELILHNLNALKGNQMESNKFRSRAMRRKRMINNLMWSKDMNCWADFNIRTRKLNEKYFYFSNLIPLLMGLEYSGVPKSIFIQYIKKSFDPNMSGYPFSFINSTQQWDYPNAWAPNQHHLIFYLIKHDYSLALKIAKKFFFTVYKGWLKTGYIYEKYNCLNAGERGSGGEYSVQTGFGWTNGVILSLINIFKDDLL